MEFLSQHKLLIALFVVVFLLGMAADFLIMWPPYQKAKNQAQQQAQLQAENLQLVKQLAALEMENKIAAVSSNELRKSFETQQERLVEQEKELNFYQQLMAKRPGEKGLALNTWSLIALPDGHYLYRFAFVQYTKQHYLLNRDLKIEIRGTLAGEEKTYALADLLTDSVELPDKLHFRYFQIVEGELALPNQFEPEMIEIVVAPDNAKSSAWQHTLPWQLKDN